MLNEFPATTVLVASDLERAKKFYTESLGLSLVPGPEGIVMFEAGKGTRIAIYEKEGGSKAIHTVLGFAVTDLDGLLSELKEKGVQQDMNDLPEGTDENGVMNYGPVRTAWINDSEGNIIALNEM